MDPEVSWTDAALARIGLEPPGAPGKPVQRRGLLADLADLATSWVGYPGSRWARRLPFEQWRSMRRRVLRADEETRAAARDRAAQLRERAELPLRCVLAFVFPGEHAWARADAEACLSAAGGAPLEAHVELLFGSLDDPDLARRLLDARLAGKPLEDAGVLAFELVHGLGARAAPALEALLGALEKETRRKTDVRHTLEATALILRDDAAAILASRLGGTDAKTIAGRYFRAAPALAMRALPPIAGGRTKIAEVARSLLAAVLAEHPDLAASALPELGAPARRAVAAVRDRAEVHGDEASPEEVPPVLARPPWRHRADRDIVVVNVEIADVAFPVDPSVHQRDAWATRLHWVPNALVFSPRVASAVGHAWLHRIDDREAAEAWLRTFPETAAVGLVPPSLREPSATRLDAERVLRFLTEVAPEAVDQAARRYGEKARAGVAALQAMDPLHDCPFEPPKLPELARVDALPRPLLRGSGRALPRAAAQHLLEMLMFASQLPPPRAGAPAEPYRGVAQVRAACDPASLDAFAWTLFEAFLAAGAPARAVWALEALGLIGGDDAARRLAAKIRSWPAEHAFARAAAGIDVLARIGTDVALMHLSSFAERTRFSELQARARERLAEAARTRGLGPDALADRIVPDLDLDADGSKVLSFGGRSFRVGFDEHLDPVVWSEDGALLRSLPRPGKADDADKARAAQETWKALKSDAAAIAGGQIQRLEQAMISGRRWDPGTFRHLLVEHPLLVHLVRRLLFAAYDAGGGLLQLFRVAEDRTFADAGDAPLALEAAAAVGLPHPLDLAPEALAAWGTIFADYQLLQPFPQIGREVFTITDEERAENNLRRFEGCEVETARLFALEHRGWRRSSVDGGENTYFHAFPGDQRASFSVSPGINFANPRETPVQKLSMITLWRWPGPRPVLGELTPIVFSELVRDFALLVG